MKTIKVKLSTDGINKAIRELQQYKNSLQYKNDEFVRRLAEAGIPVIDQNIAAAAGDSDKSHNTYIKINSYGDYSRATLVTEGKDLLYLEFGAGVSMNGAAGSSPHPLGEQFGYTIGSYGKGLGKNDHWYYYADSGELRISHGTQATMPVYKASQEIRDKVVEIAKEVFGA